MIIPNNELKDVFRSKVIKFYMKSYGIKEENLKNANDKFELILLAKDNKETKTALSNFEKEFEIYLKCLPKFKDIKKMKQDKVIDKSFMQANESTIHDLLAPIIYNVDPVYRGREVEYKNSRRRCDFAFICKKTSKCVIIEVKFGKSVDKAIVQIKDKEYQKVFEGYLEKKIYTELSFGINVSVNKKVNIKLYE